MLDKGGLKHTLERHHPQSWNGARKAAQTFFAKSTTTGDIEEIVKEVLSQNRRRIARIGANGIGEVRGVVNGITYQVGLNHGRVGQSFPVAR